MASVCAEGVPGSVCPDTHEGALQVYTGISETRRTCLFMVWSGKWQVGGAGLLQISLKGAYKQEGEQLLTRVDSDRTRGNGLKLRQGRLRLDIKNKFFHTEGGNTLEQVAQGGCGCPIPGDIQG